MVRCKLLVPVDRLRESLTQVRRAVVESLQ